MRYFILIIYLLFTIKISGQNNKVGITSEFNFESNALNLDFINSLLYGGNINEETKVKWINLSQEENKIHTLFQNEFYFKRKLMASSDTRISFNNFRWCCCCEYTWKIK